MRKKSEAQLFLEQLKKLDKMITNKLIEKEQWKTIAQGTTAPLGGERVQTSGNQQKMESAVCKYIDIEKEIDAAIDKLIDTKKDIISVIEQLPAVEYDFLHKVYVQYIELDEIAILYDKSYSWATTIHGNALKHVKEILDEREKERINKHFRSCD